MLCYRERTRLGQMAGWMGTDSGIQAEVRSLVAWLIGLTTVGGFLLGAAALNLVWIAGPLAVLAVAIAFRARLLRLYRRATGLQRLADELEATRRERDAAINRVELAVQQSQESLELGRQFGRAEVEGAVRSALVGVVPLLIGTQVIGTSATLLASYVPDSALEVGTRFILVADQTGEVRCEVVVVHLDPTSKAVHLEGVETDGHEFWDRLYDAAVLDSAPPPNSHLERVSTPIADLIHKAKDL